MANFAVKAVIGAEDKASPVLRRVGGGLDSLAGRMQKVAAPAALATGHLGGMAGPLGVLAGGAVIGGITGMVSEMADMADVTAKAADGLGLGVEQLQAWQFAMARGGVEAVEFQDAVKEMNIKMAKAMSAEGGERDLFAALGLSLADLQKMKPEEVLDHVADSFQKIDEIEDPTLRAQAAAARMHAANELFGGAGQKMIVGLKSGSEAIAAAREDAVKVGAVIAEEDMRAAEKYNDTVADLNATLRRAGMVIVGDLLPPLEKGVRWVADFAAEHKGLLTWVMGGVSGLALLAGGVAAVSGAYSMAIAPVVKIGSVLAGPAVGGVKAFTLALRSGLPVLSALRIAILSNPLGLIITAAVAAGAAAYLLWDNWDAVVSGLAEGWDWLAGQFSAVWNAITNLFGGMADSVKGTIGGLGDWLGGFDLLGGLFDAVSGKVGAVTNAFDEGLLQGILTLLTQFNPATLMIEALDGLASALFGYDLSEAGANIVNSIMDGIGDLAGRLENAIAEPLAGLREYLPFSPAKRGPLMDIDKAGANIIGNVVGGMETAADKPAAAMAAAMGPVAHQTEAAAGGGMLASRAQQVETMAAAGRAMRPTLPAIAAAPAGAGAASVAPAAGPARIEIDFKNMPAGVEAKVTDTGGGRVAITLNPGRSGAGRR